MENLLLLGDFPIMNRAIPRMKGPHVELESGSQKHNVIYVQ